MSDELLIGIICLVLFYALLPRFLYWLDKNLGSNIGLDVFDGPERPKDYEPHYRRKETYKPQKPEQPVFSFFGKKVNAYLVDPNTAILEIFVTTGAVDDMNGVIHGSFSYSETKSEKEFVKLVRSGTGFRIYNHPNLSDGKWMSCR